MTQQPIQKCDYLD